MKNVNCLENDQNMTQRQKVRECFCRDSVYRCVPHKVAANIQFVRYEMSTKSNKVKSIRKVSQKEEAYVEAFALLSRPAKVSTPFNGGSGESATWWGPGEPQTLDACAHPSSTAFEVSTPSRFQQAFSLLYLKGLPAQSQSPWYSFPLEQLHPGNWKAPLPIFPLPLLPSSHTELGVFGAAMGHAPLCTVHLLPCRALAHLGNPSSSRDVLPTCAHVQGSSLFQKGSLPFVCLEDSCSSFPTHLRCHHLQEPPLASHCRDTLRMFLAIRIGGMTS